MQLKIVSLLSTCISRLLKQPQGAPGPAKNLQEGILECLNSADFTRTSPQNALFTPWPLRLFKPGLSISVFDQWAMVNLAPMDLTRKATVHVVTVLCQYEHYAVNGVKKKKRWKSNDPHLSWNITFGTFELQYIRNCYYKLLLDCEAGQSMTTLWLKKRVHHVKLEASRPTNLWVMSWSLHPHHSLCRLHSGWKPLSFPASSATLGNMLPCHTQ